MPTARATGERRHQNPNTGVLDGRAKASNCHAKLPVQETGQRDRVARLVGVGAAMTQCGGHSQRGTYSLSEQ